MELLPVGRRPKCLSCGKELRPQFKWNPPPWNLPEAERETWRKNNPRQFLSKYGGYGDNRFCGLNCGYRYAIKTTKDKLK